MHFQHAPTAERNTQLANMHGALFLKAITATCGFLCLSTTCLGELCGRPSKRGMHTYTFGTHSYNHYCSPTPCTYSSNTICLHDHWLKRLINNIWQLLCGQRIAQHLSLYRSHAWDHLYSWHCGGQHRSALVQRRFCCSEEDWDYYVWFAVWGVLSGWVWKFQQLGFNVLSF